MLQRQHQLRGGGGGGNGEKDTLAEGLTTKDQVAILSKENIE